VRPPEAVVIDSYAFGRLETGGRTYDADVILFPDRVEAHWWRREGHRLMIDDLGTVLAYGPEVFVVGTGASGMMAVPPETRSALEAKGIRVIVQPTPEAVETFNRLLGEGKRVAAGLHLTC
jgi:hypothetical protein